MFEVTERKRKRDDKRNMDNISSYRLGGSQHPHDYEVENLTRRNEKRNTQLHLSTAWQEMIPQALEAEILGFDYLSFIIDVKFLS